MKEIKDSDVKPSPPKKPLFFYYLVALIVLMLLNVFLFPSMLERQVYEVPYSQFLTMVDDHQVTEVALDEDSCEVIDHVTAGGILVDGLGVGDVGNIVLRDRQNLAQNGIIVVVLTLEKGN